jgi:hypothetical protein
MWQTAWIRDPPERRPIPAFWTKAPPTWVDERTEVRLVHASMNQVINWLGDVANYKQEPWDYYHGASESPSVGEAVKFGSAFADITCTNRSGRCALCPE